MPTHDIDEMLGAERASDGAHAAPLIAALARHCPERSFADGDPLRRKGEHYRDMVLLREGRVAVDLALGAASAVLRVGPGQPIGEIGFLHGTPANATVTAQGPVRALVIDDAILAAIERDDGALAADLMRSLARTAADRTSYNLTLAGEIARAPGPDGIEVRMCRNGGMPAEAQRLR